MDYETITPPIAYDRLSGSDGWKYLDVRTEQEFAQGHAAGAYNVPIALMHSTGGMAPTPEFTDAVRRHFEADDKLIVGCKMGGRSMRACETLAALGFTRLANMDGGFDGARDELGSVRELGWREHGFPIDKGPQAGRDWASLRAR